MGRCCMFVKDYKLPCRHAWAVALKNHMLDNREQILRFYRTWAAQCYWLINYVQGYSCNDIRIPNVYEGNYIESKEHGDLDRPLFNPPVARRKKKKGRKK